MLRLGWHLLDSPSSTRSQKLQCLTDRYQRHHHYHLQCHHHHRRHHLQCDQQGSQDCEERFRQCEKISLKETVAEKAEEVITVQSLISNYLMLTMLKG